MKGILVLLMLVTFSAATAETGYRIVHPDGTVEFTDDATKGGEEIQLKEAPTYESVPVPPSRSPSLGDRQQPKGYQSVKILAPQQEQVIWFDGSAVGVSVQVVPALADGHSISLEMDGNEVASGSGGSFSLTEVFRGSHTLTAKVIDNSGSVVLTSEPVTFHMKRHTTNNP